jgi:hypothetical protein
MKSHIQSPDQDLNPRPPEYQVGMLNYSAVMFHLQKEVKIISD